jgi:hypothetical protein
MARTEIVSLLGFITLWVALLSPPLCAQQDSLMTVEGVVRDTVSGRPISFAIVRVAESDRSTLTTRDGRYRITVSPGARELQIRKIGYRMATIPLRVDADQEGLDVWMRPIPVELAEMTITGEYENPALAIIRNAIARKNDIFARIHDYRYDAYVKFVVRDLGKDADSAASILLITETQTTAYWEQPDRYQEVIIGRRQSSNLDAERNLVSVGQIVNFNRDRIDLGKYAVVSPTADDALQSYDYQVIDTLWDGGRMVYRLAIEPKSRARPLFVGMIDIADSTFDVRAIDVGANRALRFELFSNLRYRQRLEPVGDDAWMPVEVRFSGELHVNMPIPGFPNHLSFVHVATLENFRFDRGNAPETLGEYLIVVDDAVDQTDSLMWAERRPTPLTGTEADAWVRIDSIERRPPSFGKRLLGATFAGVGVALNEDFFHFSRVEGAFVGAGLTLRRLSPNVVLRARSGYATGNEAWQHEYGGWYRLSERQRLWVGVSYRDEVVPRPAVVSGERNTTFSALWDKDDPLDYYRQEGFAAGLQMKLVDFVRLTLAYNDVEQSSLGVVTDFSVVEREVAPRPNPAIIDGRHRSLSARLTYDSRPRLKRRGRDFLLQPFTYTEVTAGAEVATPHLIDNDFEYVRYFVRFKRRQRTLNLGLTTMEAILGASGGDLPPQRYYTVDFGRSEGPFFDSRGFTTMNGVNFSGNYLGVLRIRHDFEQQLFRRSGIPLVRDLPFTLSLHAGTFWTDFIDHAANPGDQLIATAPSPYVELGFGLGNLTPMLSPLNFGVWFLWQLSDYDTDRFRIAIGLPEF